MNEKLRWLKTTMASMDLEGMILTNPLNIKYLTNIDAEGILLINKKEIVYLTDARYVEDVQNTITIADEISVYEKKDFTTDDYENIFMFCENVGFEEFNVTYAGYKELMQKYKVNNMVETENLIEKQRMIKDNEELECIKQACKITDECYSYILEYIKPGMTEKHIANKIEKYFTKYSDGLAFDTIVASGENTSKPHAIPSDREIQEIDIIMIDMGCKINGYSSDMTRTFFVGEVGNVKEELYKMLLRIQNHVEIMMKDGASTRQIAKFVEMDLAQNRFELLHSIGHGVGLEIHELPYISTVKDSILKENMVVTNEPGIYIPGKFGIRIEDTIKVMKGGNIPLTKSSKNCKVICIK